MRTILASTLLAAILVTPGFAQANVEAAPAAAAQATDSAMAAFRKQHDAVIELIDKGAPADKVQALVDALLDYDWIADAALSEKKCEDRCDQFEELLTKLIRENYLKRIYAKDRGTVIYVDENVRPKSTKVNTIVTFTDTAGTPHTVEVAYVMHKVDENWEVRDIITDGVSLSRNYKFEFNKLYREGGMDLVISRLQTKLAELASAPKN